MNALSEGPPGWDANRWGPFPVECRHDSATETDTEDEWRCDECGVVYRMERVPGSTTSWKPFFVKRGE